MSRAAAAALARPISGPRSRQHGLPRFRAASLPEDTALLLEARRRVLGLRDRFGSLEAPGVGPLMDEARRRFGDERVEQIAA